jgi:FkbM family methyltransferase
MIIPTADLSPYGTHDAGPVVRKVLAVTRGLPATWLGLRLSQPLRRLAINGLRGRPVDTEVWNCRARLYPSHNGCEKNALFQPQLFDKMELDALAEAVDARVAQGGTFTFVDIGANVGLYSLFVASRAKGQARIVAIEPQPGIVERLRFNMAENATFDVTVAPVAVADRETEMELVINQRDSGGSRLNRGADHSDGTVTIQCRPLTAILDEAGMSQIDAMKLDIEGAEDLALVPFFRATSSERWPRLIVMEDQPANWSVDLHALLQECGYAVTKRARINTVWRLGR